MWEIFRRVVCQSILDATLIEWDILVNLYRPMQRMLYAVSGAKFQPSATSNLMKFEDLRERRRHVVLTTSARDLSRYTLVMPMFGAAEGARGNVVDGLGG
jgi:hypothetical protein